MEGIEGAIARHPTCVDDVELDGRACGEARCDDSDYWESDIPSPRHESSECTASPLRYVRNDGNGYRYAVDGEVAVSGETEPGALVEIWHAASEKRWCHRSVVADSGQFVVNTTRPVNYGPPLHFEMRVSLDGFEPLYTKVYIGDDPVFQDDMFRANPGLRFEHRLVFLADASYSLGRVRLRRAPADSKRFRGVWSDGSGAIEIVSNGRLFVASEVPTPRDWGSLGGVHSDASTIEDVPRLGRGSLIDEGRIDWASEDTWFRTTLPVIQTFRYFRLWINETLRRRGGLVQFRNVELRGPLGATPEKLIDEASCWASTNSPECWKAFDDDRSSFWISDDVGGWQGTLSAPQILGVDVGPLLAFRPASLRLDCDVACPKYFQLQASHDNSTYEVLMAHRALERQITLNFEFAPMAFEGRSSGARCGSCDSRERGFACAAGDFDRTCASGFCALNGTCAAAVPDCEARGTYRPFFGAACQTCEPGRYLIVDECLPCPAGHQCPDGQLDTCETPPQYCPQGTASASRVPAGYVVVGDATLVECPPGSYCVDGLERPCPAGTYGNASGLRSSGCSAPCRSAGSWCPEGSVRPKRCDPGFYCPGNARPAAPCPAGRLARSPGSTTSACEGLCSSGHYCHSGSVELTPCPAGRLGSSRGLTDHACDGDCPAGFYCPEASRNATPCGRESLYCPEASPAPRVPDPGYYADGGDALDRHVRQSPCPPGFACSGGVRAPCRAGTFNGVVGVELAHILRTNASHVDCPSLCPRGSYCPAAATRPTPCPAGRYANDTRSDSCLHLAPRGTYAPPGSAMPVPCPAGRYGATRGLRTDACSESCAPLTSEDDLHRAVCQPAECDPGYYCDAGSVHPRPRECGLGSYCPRGSARPTPLDPGFCGAGSDSPYTRYFQIPCDLADPDDPSLLAMLDNADRQHRADQLVSRGGPPYADVTGLL